MAQSNPLTSPQGRSKDADLNSARAVLKTEQDALAVLEQLVPVEFDQPYELNGGGQVRFVQAGHILGAAIVEFPESGRPHSGLLGIGLRGGPAVAWRAGLNPPKIARIPGLRYSAALDEENCTPGSVRETAPGTAYFSEDFR